MFDQNTRMMNGSRKSKAENNCLQPTFKEVFGAQRQDIVQFPARVVQHTETDEPANECITLKEAFRVFFVKSEQDSI